MKGWFKGRGLCELRFTITRIYSKDFWYVFELSIFIKRVGIKVTLDSGIKTKALKLAL